MISIHDVHTLKKRLIPELLVNLYRKNHSKQFEIRFAVLPKDVRGVGMLLIRMVERSVIDVSIQTMQQFLQLNHLLLAVYFLKSTVAVAYLQVTISIDKIINFHFSSTDFTNLSRTTKLPAISALFPALDCFLAN